MPCRIDVKNVQIKKLKNVKKRKNVKKIKKTFELKRNKKRYLFLV